MQRRNRHSNPLRKIPHKPPNTRTVDWEDLPEWRRDNEYIRSGYRRELRSFKACAASVFGYLHNESVNINSHLGGAVLFVVLAFVTYPYVLAAKASVTWKDISGFYVFIAAALFCLLSSAAFHAVTCHSQVVSKRCNALDYTGIVVLIVGSFFPSLHYGFFCDPWLHKVYLTGICTAGGFAAYIVLSPTYSKPAYRWARTTVFIALGLGGVVPVTHGLFTSGFSRMKDEMGLLWILLSGLLYISGAVIYASRVPEKWYPGRFDYFGASHQIFHVHVVLAVLAHYVGVLTAFNHHHGLRGGECLI